MNKEQYVEKVKEFFASDLEGKRSFSKEYSIKALGLEMSACITGETDIKYLDFFVEQPTDAEWIEDAIIKFK